MAGNISSNWKYLQRQDIRNDVICLHLFRPLLREHETVWMEEDEKDQLGEVFSHFVCNGKRFVCEDGITNTARRDCSACFVTLRDNTYCLVHSGLQLLVSEGEVPRFLKVTVFEMHQKGILGESVTIIRPPVYRVWKWIRLDDVLCSVVAFRQPLNNTATLHETYRIAIPTLNFSE